MSGIFNQRVEVNILVCLQDSDRAKIKKILNNRPKANYVSVRLPKLIRRIALE